MAIFLSSSSQIWLIYIKVPFSYMNCFYTTKGTISDEFSNKNNPKLGSRDFI